MASTVTRPYPFSVQRSRAASSVALRELSLRRSELGDVIIR